MQPDKILQNALTGRFSSHAEKLSEFPSSDHALDEKLFSNLCLPLNIGKLFKLESKVRVSILIHAQIKSKLAMNCDDVCE